MPITSILPQIELREIVREYRIVHLKLSDIPSCKPYAPRAEQCLNFYPRNRESVVDQYHKTISDGMGIALIGQQTEMTHRYVHGDFLVITVVFRQGAIFRMTGIPAYELTKTYLDAEMIFGKSISFVNERLSNVKSYVELIVIIEEFLRLQISKLKSLTRIDHSAEAMLRHNMTSLDEVAERSCLSIRQFRRSFFERIGVTPKVFSRIIRFERACQSITKQPDRDLLDVAVSCGFTDYQHMAKDYRNFTGQSPLNFHLLDRNAPEKLNGELCN